MTELCGNFVHGSQTLPVYAGENAVRYLDKDVDVFTPEGKPAQVGERWELVCKKPFPSMPAMLWNDPDRKKYRAAYFNSFPHVWCHGDFIRFDPETGASVMPGRSDGVLNPSGIRFGSGEIYTILERCAEGEVVDAICGGQQRLQDETEQVFLFLQTRGGGLTDDLQDRIRKQIQTDLSRRHVPHYMSAVQQIPYNVNGKKLEIPLRAVLSEGKKAFTRRKFTSEEVKSLEPYMPYFRVEELTEGHRGQSREYLKTSWMQLCGTRIRALRLTLFGHLMFVCRKILLQFRFPPSWLPLLSECSKTLGGVHALHQLVVEVLVRNLEGSLHAGCLPSFP